MLRGWVDSLRESLATIPWVDGREVDMEDKADCERRIRAEVNDMENCMREHIRRIADVRLSCLCTVAVAMARTHTASQSYA